MKVIFLDFDGVLNSHASFIMEGRKTKEQRGMPVNETLCHVCCSNLQHVLDVTPGTKIVISSTWRELFSIDWLKTKLASYGIDSSLVIDKTPSIRLGFSHTGSRGAEIKEWLSKHPEVTDFVVIDDNDWGISELYGDATKNFVQTSWASGMQLRHSLAAIKILGGHVDFKIDYV